MDKPCGAYVSRLPYFRTPSQTSPFKKAQQAHQAQPLKKAKKGKRVQRTRPLKIAQRAKANQEPNGRTASYRKIGP